VACGVKNFGKTKTYLKIYLRRSQAVDETP
jgi:hypothetical protein